MANPMLALFSNPQTSELDNIGCPSPPQAQLTSESSSCPSDNEISSLYGKYRHSSSCSLKEESLQDASLEQDHSSTHNSFTHGDDANGLPQPSPSAPSSAVIDELNWMLGEAIDSAQTTFGNSLHSSSESHQPQSSPNSRSHHPSLINPLSRLSIEAENTPLKVMQLVQHSIEDLSEPITSSSLSDYSIDATEQDIKRQQYVRVSSNDMIHSTRAMAINDSLMNNHSYDLRESLNSSPPPLNKKYSTSAISALAHSTSSEEILSIATIEEPDVQLDPRTPSQKNQDLPLILGAEKQIQDIVATTHKRIAHRDQLRQSTSPAAIPVTPSQDSPSSKPLLRDNSQKSINIRPKKLFEEDGKLAKSTATPNGNGKPLVARSPVVKRSSSDINFLEQWQWLEAQLPSHSSSPQKKHSSSPTQTKQPSHDPSPSLNNTREKRIQALDHHFRSSSSCGSIESKMAALLQRQRSLQQSLQRPNANKSGRAIKPVVACFDCVPRINIKELKKLKATVDRRRVYETKLQQLYSQPLGLDLWVWLKTCGESNSSLPPPVHEAAHQTSDSRSSYSQIRKPGYSPLLNHHQPLLSSLPAHLQRQQSSPGNSSLAKIRDTSMSSVASFPLRAGSHTQKAIQIRSSSENQLMEMILPDGGGMVGRSHGGMMVNSLMEVNNLPYPSLYPHSAVGPNVGVNQAGPSALERRSSHDHGGESGNPSKGVGFFSQITRHNSSKRRHQSATASSSPTMGGGSSSSHGLVISPPLLAGAPMAAPRGPRPEGPSSFRPDLKALFAKPLELTTRLPHDDRDRLPSPGPRSPYRMSFAYGSSSPSSPVQRLPPTTTHNNRLAAFQPHHSTVPHLSHHASVDRRPPHYLTSQHHPSSLTSSPQDPSNPASQMHQKLDKLADILPHADRAILRQILLENHLDDVVSIGCYLERERAKNIS